MKVSGFTYCVVCVDKRSQVDLNCEIDLSWWCACPKRRVPVVDMEKRVSIDIEITELTKGMFRRKNEMFLTSVSISEAGMCLKPGVEQLEH